MTNKITNLCMMRPEWILWLDPDGPDVGLQTAGGQLRVLRPVEDDQRLLVVVRDLVVHQQPVQLNHKVYLQAGLDFSKTRVHEIGHVNAVSGVMCGRVIFHLQQHYK